ncbi:MAG: glycosyltransferase family 2 protein [Planctomycetota bacterium]
MTLLAGLMLFAAMSCAGALVMAIVNLKLYHRPPQNLAENAEKPLLSVCVPARDEEDNIEACVRSVLDGTYANCEVLVYDDQSTDATPEILARIASQDDRLKLVETVPLPSGWAGKQHACWRMSQAAQGEWMLFTDADVRFSTDMLERTLAHAQKLKSEGDSSSGSGVGLLSTFPRQITKSFGEVLLVPMIFFILFSYLPMWRMRQTNDPSTSAACGQFLFVRRDAYDQSGGHEAFKDSYHDGIKMPRAVRRAGFKSDLFDGQDLASVRMYRGFAQSWSGFAKNAFEGLGSLGLLIFLTFVHTVAHAAPIVVFTALVVAKSAGAEIDVLAAMFAFFAVFFAILERWILSDRFGQGPWPVLLHPLGALAMTAVQWHSFILSKQGKRAWRGRVLGQDGGEPNTAETAVSEA